MNLYGRQVKKKKSKNKWTKMRYLTKKLYKMLKLSLKRLENLFKISVLRNSQW